MWRNGWWPIYSAKSSGRYCGNRALGWRALPSKQCCSRHHLGPPRKAAVSGNLRVEAMLGTDGLWPGLTQEAGMCIWRAYEKRSRMASAGIGASAWQRGNRAMARSGIFVAEAIDACRGNIAWQAAHEAADDAWPRARCRERPGGESWLAREHRQSRSRATSAKAARTYLACS